MPIVVLFVVVFESEKAGLICAVKTCRVQFFGERGGRGRICFNSLSPSTSRMMAFVSRILRTGFRSASSQPGAPVYLPTSADGKTPATTPLSTEQRRSTPQTHTNLKPNLRGLGLVTVGVRVWIGLCPTHRGEIEHFARLLSHVFVSMSKNYVYHFVAGVSRLPTGAEKWTPPIVVYTPQRC